MATDMKRLGIYLDPHNEIDLNRLAKSFKGSRSKALRHILSQYFRTTAPYEAAKRLAKAKSVSLEEVIDAALENVIPEKYYEEEKPL
jgi:predicted component of viral defense system (DUF524 family)